MEDDKMISTALEPSADFSLHFGKAADHDSTTDIQVHVNSVAHEKKPSQRIKVVHLCVCQNAKLVSNRVSASGILVHYVAYFPNLFFFLGNYRM